MSTASKLWFGFGLLLALLVGIGLFVAHRLASIERALSTITAVQEPATAATYEMALNVAGTSAAVLEYVTVGGSAPRSRVVVNHAAFERFISHYGEIARSADSRALGRQILGAYRDFRALGDTLMGASDLERARFADYARSEEQMRLSIARDLRGRLDGRGRDGQRKRTEAALLEAHTARVGSALGLYRRTADGIQRERIAGFAEDFRATLERLLELRLNDDERAAVLSLRARFPGVLADAREAADRVDRVRALLGRFTRRSSQLQRLVSEGIHSLARTDLIEAQRSARRAIHVAMIAVLVLLVAGIVIGGSTALPVAQSVVRSERSLRERMEELALADQRKDEFLGVLGHELRNPLAPISNSLHVLEAKAESVPEDVRRTYAMMRRQIESMTRIVDDLLDVSRISQGKIMLRRQPVDLGAVLRGVAEDLGPIAREHRHELKLSLAGPPVWVQADPTRIAQIVANLLHNSIKYTPDGGHIELSLARDDAVAVVRVRDDGIGLPPDMVRRVFEPFTQVDGSLSRPHGGLGIGLTLVQRLVELHGGGVAASSPGPGQGSTFTVRLPCLEAAPAEPPAAAPRPSPAAAAPPRRILVVDDNVDSAESMGSLLALWGHEVRIEHEGPAALDAARRWRPDLVLLDIGLPGMDGYRVAEELRRDADPGALRLIALTGLGQEDDRQRSIAAGFDHHLTKPVSPDALREWIDRPRG